MWITILTISSSIGGLFLMYYIYLKQKRLTLDIESSKNQSIALFINEVPIEFGLDYLFIVGGNVKDFSHYMFPLNIKIENSGKKSIEEINLNLQTSSDSVMLLSDNNVKPAGVISISEIHQRTYLNDPFFITVNHIIKYIPIQTSLSTAELVPIFNSPLKTFCIDKEEDIQENVFKNFSIKLSIYGKDIPAANSNFYFFRVPCHSPKQFHKKLTDIEQSVYIQQNLVDNVVISYCKVKEMGDKFYIFEPTITTMIMFDNIEDKMKNTGEIYKNMVNDMAGAFEY